MAIADMTIMDMIHQSISFIFIFLSIALVISFVYLRRSSKKREKVYRINADALYKRSEKINLHKQ